MIRARSESVPGTLNVFEESPGQTGRGDDAHDEHGEPAWRPRASGGGGRLGSSARASPAKPMRPARRTGCGKPGRFRAGAKLRSADGDRPQHSGPPVGCPARRGARRRGRRDDACRRDGKPRPWASRLLRAGWLLRLSLGERRSGRAVHRAATDARDLQAHAADAGKPLGAYVAESILVPGAYAAPGYVSGMMQPPRGLTSPQVEDLVSYLIGKPWTSPAGGPAEAAGEADCGVRGEGVVPGHGRPVGKGRAAARRGARRREDRRDLWLPLLPPVRGQRSEERVGARPDPGRPQEDDGRRAREAAAVPRPAFGRDP